MGIIDTIKRKLQESKDAKEFRQKQRYWENVNISANELLNKSLTCRKCGDVSVPVFKTESHYICVNCENRFSGSKHFLGQTNLRHQDRYENSSTYWTEIQYNYPYYEDAVKHIKNYHSKHKEKP